MLEISFTGQDWVGIVLGFAFVFLVLGVAEGLRRGLSLDAFVTRKLVHISVAHWWLIAWYFHDTLSPALVGPVAFTILNYIDYRRNLFRGVNSDQSTGNYGAVLFPVALIILCILTFGGPFPVYTGAAGILVLGYGDGFAALVGRRFGKRGFRIFGHSKTVVGSAAMCVGATVVVFLITLGAADISSIGVMAAVSLCVAIAATALEFFTPWNLDNLTVPAGAMLVYVLALNLIGAG